MRAHAGRRRVACMLALSLAVGVMNKLLSSEKARYIEDLGRPEAAKGWHFLTGDEDQIKRLADAVGFKFVYNPRKDQYIHSAGLVVLTPDGTLSRYFYGMEFPPRDLQFAMIDASDGKVGSPSI